VSVCCILQGQVWGAFEVNRFIHWHLHLWLCKEARFDPALPCPVLLDPSPPCPGVNIGVVDK
jgi:hypothetical protein